MTYDIDHAFAQANERIDMLENMERERAELWARYGPFGTFEHERKNLLAACRDEIRLALLTRTSEAAIDDAARQNARYTDLIANAYTERTQLALLDARCNALTYKIEQNKSYNFAAGKLAGLQ